MTHDPDDPEGQNECAERLMRYASELHRKAANDDGREPGALGAPQADEELPECDGCRGRFNAGSTPKRKGPPHGRPSSFGS